jgi:rRNA processing protein Krr1/Pno1
MECCDKSFRNTSAYSNNILPFFNLHCSSFFSQKKN